MGKEWGGGEGTRGRVAPQPLADRTERVSCARGRRQRGPAPRAAFQQGAREGRLAAEPGAEIPRGSGVGEGGGGGRGRGRSRPGARAAAGCAERAFISASARSRGRRTPRRSAVCRRRATSGGRGRAVCGAVAPLRVPSGRREPRRRRRAPFWQPEAPRCRHGRGHELNIVCAAGTKYPGPAEGEGEGSRSPARDE